MSGEGVPRSRRSANIVFSPADLAKYGACGGEDPNLFIGSDTDISMGAEVERITKAKEICHRCPVMMRCRWFAWDNRDLGVWGGLNHTYKTHGAYRKSRKQWDADKEDREARAELADWTMEVLGNAVAPAITSKLPASDSVSDLRARYDRSA